MTATATPPTKPEEKKPEPVQPVTEITAALEAGEFGILPADANLFFRGTLTPAEVVDRTKVAKEGILQSCQAFYELKYNDNWEKHPKGYKTWEDYCEAEFPFTKRHIDALANNYGVLVSIPQDSRKFITSMRQLTELSPIPAESRETVLIAARQTAVKEQGEGGDPKKALAAPNLSAALIKDTWKKLSGTPGEDTKTADAGEGEKAGGNAPGLGSGIIPSPGSIVKADGPDAQIVASEYAEGSRSMTYLIKIKGVKTIHALVIPFNRAPKGVTIMPTPTFKGAPVTASKRDSNRTQKEAKNEGGETFQNSTSDK